MKKLMKKKVNVFGKSVPILMIAMIAVLGVASAALIPYFGQITGQVTVSQGLVLDGVSYDTPIIYSATMTSLEEKTFSNTHTLANSADVDAVVNLDTTCDGNVDGCAEIDTIVQAFAVGTDINAFIGPTCDITVQLGESIQTAIDDAIDTNVICVAAGTYNEAVLLNKGVTLSSIDGADTTTISKGVRITADNVVLTGFNIISTPILRENVAVYLDSTSNTVIAYNDIEGNGAANARGITLTTSATYSNVNINNNLIHDMGTGIYTNTHTGVVNIEYNEIYNTFAGIGGFTGANVNNNLFHDNSEAIGADNSLVNYILEYNHFAGTDTVKAYGGVSIDATNNYWGTDGADITGNVDTRMTKTLAMPITVPAGESVDFVLSSYYPQMMIPDTYTLTTTVTA